MTDETPVVEDVAPVVDAVEVVESPAEVEEPAEQVVEPPAGETDGAGVTPDVSTAAPSPGRGRKKKKAAAADPDAPAGPRYFALKPMTLPSRTVAYGDEVPEAASWTRPEAYVRLGYLRVELPDAE